MHTQRYPVALIIDPRHYDQNWVLRFGRIPCHGKCHYIDGKCINCGR